MKEDKEPFALDIEKKIQEMESVSYEFPTRFSRKDYIFTIVVILSCLVMVVMGAWIK